MAHEYRYVDGTLRQGYYCNHCGQNTTLIGHLRFSDSSVNYSCKSNQKLVHLLIDANPLPINKVKPHFIAGYK